MPVDATLKSNVRWGVMNGLRVAFALSVFVTLEFLVVGSAPFDHVGATLWTTILAYVLMGILAGAVVGALRPQANRSIGGAAVVGAVAGLPSGLAMLLALKGMPSHWGGAEIFGALVGAPLLGAYAAIRYVSD